MSIYSDVVKIEDCDDSDLAQFLAVPDLRSSVVRETLSRDLGHVLKHFGGYRNAGNEDLFVSGRVLYEGMHGVGDKDRGLNMMHKSAESGCFPALDYLIGIYSERGDWKKVIEYRRWDTRKENTGELMKIVVDHPYVVDKWTKDTFDTMLKNMIIHPGDTEDEKMLFITFYLTCINQDPAVLVKCFPDDLFIIAAR
jgi:hypothetical protein